MLVYLRFQILLFNQFNITVTDMLRVFSRYLFSKFRYIFLLGKFFSNSFLTYNKGELILASSFVVLCSAIKKPLRFIGDSQHSNRGSTVYMIDPTQSIGKSISSNQIIPKGSKPCHFNVIGGTAWKSNPAATLKIIYPYAD